MLSEFCINVNSVAIQIGDDDLCEDIRICLPFMNVAIENGNEMPEIWPPDVLREAGTGTPLLTPDGTPLLVAGP